MINRLPTPVLNNISPFQKLFHHQPDYSTLKTFGCACYPTLRPYNRHKFDFRTARCIFIGYNSQHKGYQCLHSSKRVYISNHVTFDENSFTCESGADFSSLSSSCQSTKNYKSSFNSSVPSVTQLQAPLAASSEHHQNVHHSDAPTPSPNSTPLYFSDNSNSASSSSPPHNSPPHTLPQPASTGHPMITRSKAGIFKPKIYLLALLAQKSEPTSVSQALSDPMWYKAMQEEYLALKTNHTWDLVLPATPVKIVGSKWVFRIKYNSDGSVSRYKVRLVAKGFHQTHGIDHTKTFSPVVKASTVRVILSLAVLNQWVIRQVDVNNAFLNGILIEEVYMAQPEGFVDSTKPNHICKLNKALYGLKQAPRAWFDRFKDAMISKRHFQHSRSDNSLFHAWNSGHLTLVSVYVDDIIITSSSPTLIQQVIQSMNQAFALKDMGELSYFLGIEVSKSSQGVSLTQAKYITDILDKHGMTDCSPVPTPMSTGSYLTKESGELIDNVSQYRSVIGALQYVTLTRPDIAFSVNKLSQFLSSPRTQHWKACKRLLRYLKGTIHLGLQFNNKGALQLHCFSDSDWACDRDDKKSVAGFAVYLGPNLVSWSSKKQAVVSKSSTEAEYRSLAHAASEVPWIQSLLGELNIKLSSTPMMWCDNQEAIALAYNPVYHAKTKHVELDIHFIRDKVTAKEIEVCFVPSQDQTADVLTKAYFQTV